MGCNEFGFFGQLLDVYRKISVTSLITSKNKAIRFCFFPYPTATMFYMHLPFSFSSEIIFRLTAYRIVSPDDNHRNLIL